MKRRLQKPTLVKLAPTAKYPAVKEGTEEFINPLVIEASRYDSLKRTAGFAALLFSCTDKNI